MFCFEDGITNVYISTVQDVKIFFRLLLFLWHARKFLCQH